MTIRQPATANLMIDSADRNFTTFQNPWNFQLIRNASILNGFFHRIATTEVVLEWSNGNVVDALGNTSFGVTIAGTNYTIALSGFFTIADLLNAIANELNTNATPPLPGGTTFSVAAIPGGGANLTISAGTWTPIPGVLAAQLGWPAPGDTPLTPAASQPVYPNDADLRPFRYLDFICSQLTYNQDLKDAATQTQNKDVLCRWYFSYDNPLGNDAYGFPIRMGYESFQLRRLFSPPKQIRWDSIQPLGNLTFEVYGATQGLNYVPLALVYPTVADNQGTEWLMTLQVSEN